MSKPRPKTSAPGRETKPRPKEAEHAEHVREAGQLWAFNNSNESIYAALKKKFGLTPRTAEHALNEAKQIIRGELRVHTSDEGKAKQLARLTLEISSATVSKNFGAVASLERMYADIIGSAAPKRVHVEVDSQVRVAFEAILGSQTQKVFDAIARGERPALLESYDESDDATEDGVEEQLPS